MPIDPLTLSALAVCAGVLFFGIRIFRRRMEEQRYREELADLEFQQTLLSSVDITSSADDVRFLQKSNPEVATSPGMASGIDLEKIANLTPDPASAQLLEPQQPGSPVPADVTASAVMQQLNATGLVAGLDGYVPLHNNPKGSLLIRFRNGKRGLLVPHMESETYLRANARRADMIIMAGADGKAVVITSLEQFLAETISPS